VAATTYWGLSTANRAFLSPRDTSSSCFWLPANSSFLSFFSLTSASSFKAQLRLSRAANPGDAKQQGGRPLSHHHPPTLQPASQGHLALHPAAPDLEAEGGEGGG